MSKYCTVLFLHTAVSKKEITGYQDIYQGGLADRKTSNFAFHVFDVFKISDEPMVRVIDIDLYIFLEEFYHYSISQIKLSVVLARLSKISVL
jgi:hypothetical protein